MLSQDKVRVRVIMCEDGYRPNKRSTQHNDSSVKTELEGEEEKKVM